MLRMMERLRVKTLSILQLPTFWLAVVLRPGINLNSHTQGFQLQNENVRTMVRLLEGVKRGKAKCGWKEGDPFPFNTISWGSIIYKCTKQGGSTQKCMDTRQGIPP